MDITAVVVLNETPPVMAAVAVDETTLQATVNPSPGEAGGGGGGGGGEDGSTAAAAVAAHAAAPDPHPVYATQAEAAAAAPVQSVSLSAPSGWSASTTNTGGNVTLTLALPTGFSLPSNTSQANWDTAYAERLRWDGGTAGLVAATGRASLGLAVVAASGAYGDLSGRPTLGTAAATDASAYATAAGLASGLAGKADLIGGLVPTSQIPAIALVEYLGSVANQSAMLALRGEGGDWCIRTDSSTEWVIVANNGATLSDWTQLPNGISPVSSINGQTGAVTLGTGDLGESGGNLFFTSVRAIGSVLTGFVPGAGTVAATDSILQAIQKLAAGAFQSLSAATSLLLPSAAAGTPAAGHLYRVTDQLRYRDSSATEQVVLYGGGNLENLANAATARSNLGAASAEGAVTAVTHGSNASTARPSGVTAVYWIGTVEPVNAVNGDLWIGGI